MITKNVDWKAMELCIDNGLNRIRINRQDLHAAFDLVREVIMDHLSIYIDKRHMGGFCIEIETIDQKICTQFQYEGKTLCCWSV